ncbi:FAD-dependent oxidoreductase [Patescibacteria group bacterium]|nr:FAD-dependent oxidoreductase [Patescibacteria group bacterium]
MFSEHEVISNKVLNGKFNLIKLKSKNRDFKYKVGQFVTIKVKDNIFRCYSIASLPEELPFWDIFVDISPGGPGTTYLKSIKKGQVIKTLNPRGNFLLNKRLDNHIFAATGCGIAPFLPMIKELLKSKDKKIFFLWGLRFKKDIVLEDLLKSYAKANRNFSFKIILSKPEKDWKGETGHINNTISKIAKGFSYSNTGIYLSGSGEFIKESESLLLNEKFPLKRIFVEACY